MLVVILLLVLFILIEFFCACLLLVMFAYEQCLLVLGHHPDIWYEAAQYLEQSSKLLAEKGVRILLHPPSFCFFALAIRSTGKITTPILVIKCKYCLGLNKHTYTHA